MTREERALAADRVLNEPIIAEIITELRSATMEKLAQVDATQTEQIRTFQAQIRALDGLVGELRFALAAIETTKRQAVA